MGKTLVWSVYVWTTATGIFFLNKRVVINELGIHLNQISFI